VTKVEQAALWTALDKVKLGIDSEFHPRGYNIGINDGVDGIFGVLSTLLTWLGIFAHSFLLSFCASAI